MSGTESRSGRPALLRALLFVFLAAAGLVSACVDGRAPTDLDVDPLFIYIAPSYQQLPSGVAAQQGEINRIRVTVKRAGTDSVLTVFTQDVDPNLTEWPIQIPVQLRANAPSTLDLVVELLHVAPTGAVTVEFSGKLTTQVTPGQQATQVKAVDVFRGPPGNLDIQSVRIAALSVSSLIETDTLRLSASVQGGTGTTQLFWGTTNPAVATISATGLLTTVGPGTAIAFVIAGPRADTVRIPVRQKIVQVTLTPDSLHIPALNDTGRVTIRVVDPRGNAVTDGRTVLTIGDTTVVRHLGNGLFRGLRNGKTTLTVVGSRAVAAQGAAGAPALVVPDTAVRKVGVIVVEQAAARVQVDRDSLVFRSHLQSARLVAAAVDLGGTPVPNAVVRWQTTAALVATVDSTGLVTSTGDGQALVIASSGSARDTVRVRVSQRARSIVVTPAVDTLRSLGDTTTLVANVTDSIGTAVRRRPAWRSTDTAVVAVDSTGLIRARASGNALVIATIDSIADTTTVAAHFAAAQITVTPALDTLRSLGATVQFRAVALDAGGDTIRRRVTWSTSNPLAAFVDTAGVVTALGNATLDVRAQLDGLVGTATLVIQQRVVALTLLVPRDTVSVGDTLLITAQPVDSLGRQAAQTTAVWTSSDPSIARVANATPLVGRVVAVDTGVVGISANVDGVTESQPIVVFAGEPVGIDVRPDTGTVRSGQVIRLAAVPIDAAGRNTRLPDSLKVSWSSADTSVAAVDSTGNVTGRNAGPVFVRARAGTFVDSARINVVPGLATTIGFLVPSGDTTVAAGDTVGVEVEAFDARNNPIAGGWTLASTNPAVVAVLGDSAFFGQRADTTTLTARLDGASASLRVTVVHGAVRSVDFVAPSGDTTMTAGGAVALQARALDAFGNGVPSEFGFSTDAPGVVRISGDTAYAERVGSADLIASTAGVTDTVEVSVVHGGAVTVVFTTPTDDRVVVGAGGTLQTSAEATDAFGNTFSDGIGFASRNTAVANVNAQGLVTASSSAGDSTFVVASRDAAADSFLVVVEAGQLDHADVLPDADTARALGDTLFFAVVPLDAFNNPVYGAEFGVSISNNEVIQLVAAFDTTIVPDETLATEFPELVARYPHLASVDSIQLGVAVTVAIGNGTSRVIGTATRLGLTVADTSTAVVAVVPASATLDPDTITLTSVGDSATFTPTARDSNGNVLAGTSFTFTSSNTQVATVNPNGVAVAVGNGSTIIRATTSNGIEATSTLTVQQAVTQVTVTPDSAEAISFGDTLVYRAVARDARGNPVPSATYDWTLASNRDVNNGPPAGPQASPGSLVPLGDSALVLATSNGSDRIIATVNGVEGDAAVVVSQRPVGATITPDSTRMTAIGDTVTYRVSANDGRGNALQGGSYQWTVNPSSVAQIAGSGTEDSVRVVATGNGSGSVAVTVTRAGAQASDNAIVVVQATPASVTIAPDTATLTAVGGTVDLAPRTTVRDANGNTILGVQATWTSLNAAVATVSAQGVVTATAQNGTAQIVATVTGGFADTATVTVSIQAGSVDVTPDYARIDAGASSQFASAVRDALGNTISATTSWSSTNAGVASVSPLGSATGAGHGVVGIVGTVDAVADTATLAVLADSSLLSTAFVGGTIRTDVNVGQRIAVPVTLDMSKVSANGDLGSLQFTMTYNSAVLQFDSAKVGVSGLADFNGANPGTVTFGLAATAAQGSANLTLLTVHFTVKSVTAGTSMPFGLTYTADPTRPGFVRYSRPLTVPGRIRVIAAGGPPTPIPDP